jgi:hypothetical protein
MPFILYADGLWDVCDNDTCSRIVFNTLKKYPTEKHRYVMVRFLSSILKRNLIDGILKKKKIGSSRALSSRSRASKRIRPLANV